MHRHRADDRDRPGEGIDEGLGSAGVRAGDAPPDGCLRDPDEERRAGGPSIIAVVDVSALEPEGEDLDEADQREDDERHAAPVMQPQPLSPGR